MTKEIREAATALCLTMLFNLVHAGKRAGFIPVPHFILLQSKLFAWRKTFRHPIKIATIRLQWNSKAKMMQPAKIFRRRFQNFTSVEAAVPATR